MITIRLCGGLGNQLFQWALGVALGARGNQIQFDTTLLDFDPGRRYLLGDLGMKLKLTNENLPVTVQEKSLRFDPAILDLRGNHVLNGYWQSEKYFEKEANYIRQTVFSRMDQSVETARVAMNIKNFGERSCFVHVRRSDNARPDHVGGLYDGLTEADVAPYYLRAFAEINRRVPEVHYFMFSDDAAWCADNFAGTQHYASEAQCAKFPIDGCDAAQAGRGPRGRGLVSDVSLSPCDHCQFDFLAMGCMAPSRSGPNRRGP